MASSSDAATSASSLAAVARTASGSSNSSVRLPAMASSPSGGGAADAAAAAASSAPVARTLSGSSGGFRLPATASSSGAAAASSAPPAAAASGPTGPVVNRRVGNMQNSTAGPQRAVSNRIKPSVRQTLESMVSNESQAEYFRPEQTIILFDWDDTLCPSNWIRANRPALSFFKPAPNDERFQRPLRELQVHVDATLKLAMRMGKVIIVTNAMEPWVETSCRNFLPTLVPIVSQIPVIYARSIFDMHTMDATRRQPANRMSNSRSLPGLFSAGGQNKLASYNARLAMQQVDAMAPQRWKELAFEQEIAGFYSRYSHQSWKNVISIGDSIFERDAVRRVVLNRPSSKKRCRTKTAKLLDEPEIEELISEVRVIHDALGLMVQYDGNLDIEIDEEDLNVDLSFAEKIMEH